MNEIEIMIINKIEYYKMEYINADVMNQEGKRNYYGKCIKRLNKALKALNY